MMMMMIVLCPKTGPGDGNLVLRITTHDLTNDRLGQMSTGGRPKVLPVQAMERQQFSQVCWGLIQDDNSQSRTFYTKCRLFDKLKSSKLNEVFVHKQISQLPSCNHSKLKPHK